MFLPMFTKVADNFHLSSFFFSVKFLVHFLSKKFDRFSDFVLFKIKTKAFGHKQGLIYTLVHVVSKNLCSDFEENKVTKPCKKF